jgi:hypothetical protein
MKFLKNFRNFEKKKKIVKKKSILKKKKKFSEKNFQNTFVFYKKNQFFFKHFLQKFQKRTIFVFYIIMMKK